jgi:hypothetical protein
MRVSAKFFAIVALPLVLSACTETKFLDTIGAGKTSPDETGIQPNQRLSMPPDLNLPAPADADMNIATADPVAPVATDPAATDAAPQGNSPIVPGTNMTFDQQQDQLYARYGINKIKADGSPKTFDELQAELAAAVKAEKKAANPNYGTIWNIGEWFK